MLYLTYKIMWVICMIKKQETMILSEYTGIYDLVVPKDNMLRKINELIDFSFVYDELLDKYCTNNGRNAIDPIRMFKYLLLKSIFDLSDVDIVERSKYDMSFKYFLGMAPEENVIEPSSLTKFRRLRLKDINILDMLINKTVEIALEKGIIKSNSIIVDATHTAARYNQKSPREVLQERSKKLRKSVYEIDENIKNTLPAKNTIDNLDAEIKYCQDLVKAIEKNDVIAAYPKVREKLNMLNETLEDDINHIQACADADARIGHKSVDTSFFGYKTHIAMTQDRLITAAEVTSGEVNDSTQLTTLIEKSTEAGICVDEVLGDKAYSSQSNIDYMNKNKIRPITRKRKYSLPEINEEKGFVYNKDSDTFACKAGHLAKSKKFKRRKKVGSHINNAMEYQFDVEKCKKCPYREGCYKPGAKTKTYTVTIPEDHKDPHLSFEETEYFNKRIKERYKIEAKNGELKQAHGFDRCKYMGLSGMKLQTGLSVFVVNIKRILKLMEYQIG